MMRQVRPDRRCGTDRGASAVEYGLLVAGLVGALILAIAGLERGTAAAFHAGVRGIEATPDPGPVTAPSATTPSTETEPTASGQPIGSVAVRRGESVKQDVGAGEGAKKFTATVSPLGAGTVSWDSGELVLRASKSAAVGTKVTVTYGYTTKNVDTTGTQVFWITR